MKILGKFKEEHLLSKLKKGNKEVFIQLYDQYAPQIYRFIFLKINSLPEAEDLTSEVFLRLWREINSPPTKLGASPNSIKNPRAWLYQIARNLVIDFYRKKPQTELILDEKKEKVFENIPSQETDLIQKKVDLEADLVQIRKALSQIKAEYQDLILWHYLDDFSVKEIAQILERSEGAVRVQLHRALKALQRALK